MISVETVQPENPGKLIPRHDAPEIQAIVSQKPNPFLSYSKFVMATESLGKPINKPFENAMFLHSDPIFLVK